ncbi:MAG: GNAT family N-acetyltransferase [Candidatus Bathyarchaeota archaeon]|nr:GNAT family N-acetyltransferase [Candidatus Bathyarchaeota archaeon]
MATIKIRPAKPSDVETIVEFQIRLAAESEMIELDREEITEGVYKLFQCPEKGCYWIAEVDKQILGCLRIMPEWNVWKNSTILWIHSLYVIPEARRRGIFKAFYIHIKNKVKRTPNLTGIRLYVAKDNRIAQMSYEAMGMIRDHYHLYEWIK